MKITEIELSCTKNLGNYENQRIAYRAILEPWENPEKSLEILRNKIAEELNLRAELKELRHRHESRKRDLEMLESRLKDKRHELAQAQLAWENFAEFLIGHGVDPESLSIENFAETKTRNRYVLTTPKLTDTEKERILCDLASAEASEETEGYYSDDLLKGDESYF